MWKGVADGMNVPVKAYDDYWTCVLSRGQRYTWDILYDEYDEGEDVDEP